MQLARRAVSLLIPFAIVLGVVMGAIPAHSVTQAEVDAACADSSAAYEQYKAKNTLFEDSVERYQTTSAELETTSLRGNYLRDRLEERTGEVFDVRERVQQRAVEMYISASTSMTDMLLSSTSMGQLLAGRQFIETATRRDVASLDRLQALRNDLSSLRGELKVEEDRLRVLRTDQEQVKNTLEEVTVQAEAAWRQLNSNCKELEAARAREIALREALEAARRRGSGAGIPPELTPGFRCPMDSGPSHFINDWGFPRSGGRTHKGTDIFAPYGQPVYAAAAGVVNLGNSGLGGRSVWLTASEYGASFYYAHLSGWAPGLSAGDRVNAGELIGYNGDSGNARGGSPHVHFQVHPGGRGSAPVNPYTTLVNFGCR